MYFKKLIIKYLYWWINECIIKFKIANIFIILLYHFQYYHELIDPKSKLQINEKVIFSFLPNNYLIISWWIYNNNNNNNNKINIPKTFSNLKFLIIRFY